MKQAWERALCLMELANSNEQIQIRLYGDGPTVVRVRAEAPGLLLALREGRVDGSTYTGECACLVGTIANIKGRVYNDIPGLSPNSSRPIERFFLAISKGDTPATNPMAKIVEGWLLQFLGGEPAP